MDKETKKAMFVWKSLGDSTPLPTDYSQNMLKEKWNRSRPSINKEIANNPIFDDFYQWMRYCSPEQPHSDEYKARGVPAELEPFFHEYCMEADRSPQYDALLSGKVPSEFHHAFALHLHEKARVAEKEPETNAENVYWYRRLYENREFQAEISQEYWNREYEWRAQLLKELSLALPQAQQITQLKHLISFMDTEIAAMLHLTVRDQAQGQNEEKKTILHTFPQQLLEQLRSRKLYNYSPNERVAYDVPDIPLSIHGKPGITSMQQAFVAIKNKTLKQAEILESVLPEYLNAVCSVPEKSDFQTACESLQEYLDLYVAENENSDEINTYVYQRCVQYYGKILWNSVVPAGAIQPGVDQTNGVKLLIDEIISSMYSKFIVGVSSEVQFLIDLCQKDISKHCEQYREGVSLAMKNGVPFDGVYEATSKMQQYMVGTLWDELLFGPVEIVQKEVPQDLIDKLSSEMETYCQSAYQNFCGMTLPWASLEYMKSLWHRYNEIQNAANVEIPPVGGDVRDIHLCVALLFCRVWAEYCRTAASAMNCYHQLTSYINKRKDGSL